MAALTFTTIAFIIIGYFDVWPKWKAGQKKLFWVGALFLLGGYVILALTSFEIRAPSPIKPFEYLVYNILGIKPQ